MKKTHRIPFALLAAAVLLTVAMSTLSGVARHLIEQAFLDMGAERVTAGEVSVSPLSGQVHIHNLAVRALGREVLHARWLRLHLDLPALWQGRLMIRRLILDGAYAELVHEDGRWELAGLHMGNAGAPGPAIRPGIGLLELTQSRLKLQLDQGPRLIGIRRMVLEGLYGWAPEQPARLEFDLRLAASQLRFSGHVTAALAASPALTGQLRVSRLDLDAVGPLAGLEGITGRLDARLQVSYGTDAQGNTTASARGSIGLDRPAWNGEGGHIGAGRLQWEGEAVLTSGGTIEATAAIRLNGLSAHLKELDGRLESLQWDGRLIAAADASRVELDGRILAKKPAAHLHGRDLRTDTLHWQGMLALEAEDDDHAFAAEGRLQLSQTVFTQPRMVASMDSSAMGLRARYAPGGGGLRLDIDRSELDGLRFNQEVPGIHARLEHLQALDVQLGDGHRLTVNGLDLHGLVLRPDERADADERGLSWEQARVRGVRVDARRAEVDEAILHRLHLAMVREQDGLRLPIAPGEDREPDRPDGLEHGFSWALGRLRVEGESMVRLLDRTVSPPVEHRLEQVVLELGGLDSLQPQQDTALDLALNLHGQGRLTLKGHLRPLAREFSTRLDGRISNLPLPAFNPYLEPILKDKVKSGQLILDSRIEVEGGQLRVDNDIRLIRMEMAGGPQQPEEAHPGATGLELLEGARQEPAARDKDPLPIGLALQMLRDSQGNIRLDLPVTGTLDDPDFDLSDAVNQAVASSMQTGILLFFQPLGTLVTIAKLAGSAMALRFQPVEFDAGEAAMDEKDRAYLQALADKLKERPQVYLTLCGVANGADRRLYERKPGGRPAEAAGDGAGKPARPDTLEIDQALMRLAGRRADAVRAYLVEKGGIAAERLAPCMNRIDTGAGSLPRVEIGSY